MEEEIINIWIPKVSKLFEYSDYLLYSFRKYSIWFQKESNIQKILKLHKKPVSQFATKKCQINIRSKERSKLPVLHEMDKCHEQI